MRKIQEKGSVDYNITDKNS